MRTSVSSKAGRAVGNAARTAATSPNSHNASPASRKASASTKRTPRPSSRIQMASVMTLLQRQVQREHGMAEAADAAQIAAVFVSDFALQRQAQAGAVGAAGDQRLEQGDRKSVV